MTDARSRGGAHRSGDRTGARRLVRPRRWVPRRRGRHGVRRRRRPQRARALPAVPHLRARRHLLPGLRDAAGHARPRCTSTSPARSRATRSPCRCYLGVRRCSSPRWVRRALAGPHPALGPARPGCRGSLAVAFVAVHRRAQRPRLDLALTGLMPGCPSRRRVASSALREHDDRGVHRLVAEGLLVGVPQHPEVGQVEDLVDDAATSSRRKHMPAPIGWPALVVDELEADAPSCPRSGRCGPSGTPGSRARCAMDTRTPRAMSTPPATASPPSPPVAREVAELVVVDLVGAAADEQDEADDHGDQPDEQSARCR